MTFMQYGPLTYINTNEPYPYWFSEWLYPFWFFFRIKLNLLLRFLGIHLREILPNPPWFSLCRIPHKMPARCVFARATHPGNSPAQRHLIAHESARFYHHSTWVLVNDMKMEFVKCIKNLDIVVILFLSVTTTFEAGNCSVRSDQM